MRKLVIFVLLSFFTTISFSQNIPQQVSYTRIYDFLDELATDGVIEINSAIKPYSRTLITQKLLEAKAKSAELNKRQQADLRFFLNDYAMERDTFPKTLVHLLGDGKHSDLSLVQPAFLYKDSIFKSRITPIIGMNIYNNQKGSILKKWYGFDFQATIANHLAVFGNIRDNSFDGTNLDDYTYANRDIAKLSKPQFLNNLSGAEYKEASYGGDYSDSKGGIILYNDWGSIGLVKENIVWGNSYHCSNIISGRAPSFPMISLNLKPVKWFEFNYIHAFLISNVLDSSYYYIANINNTTEKVYYRPANKYMAANMFTFKPIDKLNVSFGNSIVYAERTVQPIYLIPIAFFKSLDHLMTKGLLIENQNSQFFIDISSRNIKHLHLYGSLFVDEFSIDRITSTDKGRNPMSYKGGVTISNLLINNLSLTGEYTLSEITTYKHFIDKVTYASNSYNLGHYLGDNSQEIYLALAYRPIRGLNINASYVNAIHGKEYSYFNKDIKNTLKEPLLGEVTWRNETVALKTTYELFNNAYAVVNIEYNNARGYDLSSTVTPNTGETRLTAQQYLDYYTPKFYQGENFTFTLGFSYGF